MGGGRDECLTRCAWALWLHTWSVCLCVCIPVHLRACALHRAVLGRHCGCERVPGPGPGERTTGPGWPECMCGCGGRGMVCMCDAACLCLCTVSRVLMASTNASSRPVQTLGPFCGGHAWWCACLCTTGGGLGCWGERAGPAHHSVGPAAAATRHIPKEPWISSAGSNESHAGCSQPGNLKVDVDAGRRKTLPQQIREVATAVVWLVLLAWEGGLFPSPGSCARSTGHTLFCCCGQHQHRVDVLSLYPLCMACLVLPCACTRLQPPQQVLWRHTMAGAIHMLAAMSPYNAGPAYFLLSLAYL